MFEIFQDDDGLIRWRLIARNKKVIITSEGYTKKENVKKVIRSMKDIIPFCDVVDLTKKRGE